MRLPMTEGASILLIDDHPAVRMGLSMMLLRDRHRICGEVGGREELLAWLADTPPYLAQLALLDLSLGQESGFDLIDDLTRHAIPVLVYSMHEDAHSVDRAFACGAQGYVCKRDALNELLDAIRDVLAGQRHVSLLVAQGESVPDTPAATEHCDPLSERERQIMTMLGTGRTPAEIAEQLAIGVRTVETHCERTIAKLNLAGMRELRRRAIQEWRG